MSAISYLPQIDTDGPHVGLERQHMAFKLFRRHIGRATSDRRGLIFTTFIDFASAAEIRDFDVIVRREKDVLGAQIAMQHPCCKLKVSSTMKTEQAEHDKSPFPQTLAYTDPWNEYTKCRGEVRRPFACGLQKANASSALPSASCRCRAPERFCGACICLSPSRQTHITLVAAFSRRL